MDMTVLDEREFARQLQQENERTFLKMIDKYEAYIAPVMRAQGYKRVNQKERTVIFSFGQMTFARSRWKRGNEIRVPVDEKLGLVPRARFSKEIIYQLTKLANYMPYRKVVSVLELLKEIYVTKNSVQTALEKAGQLLQDKDDYHSLALPEAQAKGKRKAKTIYIEGDGVWVKQSSPRSDKKAVELAHFVIHTGSKGQNRKSLQNKMEIVSQNYYTAKDKLLDILYSQFDITPDTTIITNSDGGKGYSPTVFREIVSAFQPQEHLHFWDAFHVNQLIKTNLRPFPSELTAKAFQAIKMRDKDKLKTVLDTAESLIENDNKLEAFLRFRRQLLKNFKYTETPAEKGMTSKGIGVIESLHRKITYRMKNSGMYWSKRGADTMSRTILLNYAGELRDLFFGSWRKEYEQMEVEESQDFYRRFSDPEKAEYRFPTIRKRICRLYRIL